LLDGSTHGQLLNAAYGFWNLFKLDVDGTFRANFRLDLLLDFDLGLINGLYLERRSASV
jgi:hypothetical protein